MYWPDLRQAAERDRHLREHAARERATAERNAGEAYRRAYGQPKAKEADVEDADWREIPPEQLTGPR